MRLRRVSLEKTAQCFPYIDRCVVSATESTLSATNWFSFFFSFVILNINIVPFIHVRIALFLPVISFTHEHRDKRDKGKGKPEAAGYVRDRTPVIIGKISPDKANRTPMCSGGVLLALKGLIFDNDRRCSIHNPAYYTATCQNEKITSHVVSFYNLFVTQHS